MRAKTRTQKHRKILKLAKGYRLSRSRHFKAASEAVLHAGQHAYIGRKLRKRDKRKEWILQINAALSQLSMQNEQPKLSYSKFINLLKQNNIDLDRKIMAQLTTKDFESFKHLVETVSA